MITDRIQTELFSNSPTFKEQVRSGMLSVSINRWKVATALIAQIDLKEKELSTSNILLSTSESVARTMARAEVSFLEESLSKQGVRLSPNTPYSNLVAGVDNEKARDNEIVRLIGLLLLQQTWTWSVNQWIENQEQAPLYIAQQVNSLLSSLAMPPASEVESAATFYSGMVK